MELTPDAGMCSVSGSPQGIIFCPQLCLVAFSVMFGHMVVLGTAQCSVFMGQVGFREQFVVLGWNFVHSPYNIYIYIERERETERDRERERERERERGSSYT